MSDCQMTINCLGVYILKYMHTFRQVQKQISTLWYANTHIVLYSIDRIVGIQAVYHRCMNNEIVI